MQGPHAPPRPLLAPVSVVLFLLSESIDGGIKGKKICIDMGFQGRERERGRGVSRRFL